jgi:DNA-binding winged helix-turn-helix (wHTH) protein
MANSETFHFGEVTLDVRERRLLRGTEAVRLLPKAYDVLVALVQQRGRLVTKDELMRRVWPESSLWLSRGRAERDRRIEDPYGRLPRSH